MPRWARFLSCSFTGLFLALAGLFAAAGLTEGGNGFWQAAFDFAGTPAFWTLVWTFAAISMGALLVARLTVHVYRLAGPVAGLLAGGLVALVYTLFLIASQAGHWGGFALALQKSWNAAGLLLLAFGVAGAFTNWLWDRLD